MAEELHLVDAHLRGHAELEAHGCVGRQDLEAQARPEPAESKFLPRCSLEFDPLFAPNLINTYIGCHIIEKLRAHPSPTSLTCGHDVTFPEFIKYVISASETGQHRDPHFVPQHDMCNVCGERYNVIAHYETIDQDMAYVHKVLGFSFNSSALLRYNTAPSHQIPLC